MGRIRKLVQGRLLFLAGILFLGCNCRRESPAVPLPEPASVSVQPMAWEVGVATGIGNFVPEKLQPLALEGVQHLEASGMSTFFGNDLRFKMSDQEIRHRLEQAKKAADSAGLNIHSIHMPFGSGIDLSLADEEKRKQVVAAHSKLITYLKILEPEVLLFHPSYYLGLDERELRKDQLLKSALVLDEKTREIGAVMVLENMLGPELLHKEGQERPLMRSVEETLDLFKRLPPTIRAAVDMNHIRHPESLILALGKRLQAVHIADGSGEAEDHFFPCSGKGKNDWNAIFAALYEAGFTGPFMYESQAPENQTYLDCYEHLYQNYVDGL